jgi:Rps23 Pro-64 3,4-dihydroxylase Tpa1-like proline 4-hydroxylase
VLGPTVGTQHLEALQVLKYKPGTFYHPHHDTITDQIHMWSGPRMLNAFMYFNDKPDGGGETEFTHLRPTIKVCTCPTLPLAHFGTNSIIATITRPPIH